MKTTAVLCGPNVGRLIKAHWFVQGNIRPSKTKAERVLKSHGIEVVDIKKVLFPRKPFEKVECIGFYDKPIRLNKKHPSYEVEPCFIYKDEDLLLEGLEQAKVLTNTVEISENLPEVVAINESKWKLPNEFHSDVKQKIMLSCIFEATQKKLPKRKDPLRPAWNFPRDYGIDERRKNELLCKNLVKICDNLSSKKKPAVVDAFFSAPFKAHNKKIQFEMTSELAVTSSKKLSTIAEPSLTHAIDLPDIHPLDCTISINPYHFFTFKSIYPFNVKSKWPYVQTAFIHFNPTVVKNVFEEEVKVSQIESRSLLKGFSIAVAQARALYGDDINHLPEPVVVPVVQTDGKMFHFTVFQLNTLDLDKESKLKNIFWNSPMTQLYQACEYRMGKPILEEYNPDVIKRLLAFYNME